MNSEFQSKGRHRQKQNTYSMFVKILHRCEVNAAHLDENIGKWTSVSIRRRGIWTLHIPFLIKILVLYGEGNVPNGV